MKVLPHGIPELIYTCAQDYGALDFKVKTLIFNVPNVTVYLHESIGNGLRSSD